MARYTKLNKLLRIGKTFVLKAVDAEFRIVTILCLGPASVRVFNLWRDEDVDWMGCTITPADRKITRLERSITHAWRPVTPNE